MSEKKFQEDVKDSVQKIFMAGLGALATAEDEGSKLFNTLVERGENYESRGKEVWDDVKTKVDDAKDKVVDQAGTTYEKVGSKVDDAMGAALGRMGVPARDEIATLTKRVEELTTLVEKMADKPAATKTSKAAS